MLASRPVDLSGKRAIVTGASSGIGEELALQLAARKGRVVLSARRKELLEEVATRCRTRGGEAFPLPADMGSQADCKALIEQAVATLGGLDLLVLNAGISMNARLDEVADLSLYERLMTVNYLGPVWCTAAALPHLKSSRGAIAVVSSLFGKLVAPTRTGYAATKHALQGFYDCLRLELAPAGVQVTVICPGIVATGIRAAAEGPGGRPMGKDPHQASRIMSAEECARISLKAIERGRPEELMTFPGKLAVKLRAFLPGVIDRMVARRIQRS